jgi:hypothetical protein
MPLDTLIVPYNLFIFECEEGSNSRIKLILKILNPKSSSKMARIHVHPKLLQGLMVEVRIESSNFYFYF